MRINLTPIDGGIIPDIVPPSINNASLLFNASGIDNDECAIQIDPHVLSSSDKITDAQVAINTPQEVKNILGPFSSNDLLHDEFDAPLEYFIGLESSQIADALMSILSKQETKTGLKVSTYGLKYNELNELIFFPYNLQDFSNFDLSVSGALHFYTEEPSVINLFESDAKTTTFFKIGTSDVVHDEPSITIPSGAFSLINEPSTSRYIEKTSFIESLTRLMVSTKDSMHDEPELNISYTDLRIELLDPVLQLKNRLSKNPALYFYTSVLETANDIIRNNQANINPVQLDPSITITNLIDGTRYVNMKIKHSAFAGNFLLMNESMDTVVFSGAMPVGAFEFSVCTNENILNLIAIHPDPLKKLIALRKIDISSVR